MTFNRALRTLCLAALAAGVLAAGACGTRLDPNAPIVTYYYVPG